VDDNHPSIQAIRENCNFEGNPSFTEMSDDFVEKLYELLVNSPLEEL
jgi:hypothetical protein